MSLVCDVSMDMVQQKFWGGKGRTIALDGDVIASTVTANSRVKVVGSCKLCTVLSPASHAAL